MTRAGGVCTLLLCHLSAIEHGGTDPRGKAGGFETSVLGELEWRFESGEPQGTPVCMEACRGGASPFLPF